eukprot:8422613-Ditylum_brightwellii.AAC.1
MANGDTRKLIAGLPSVVPFSDCSFHSKASSEDGVNNENPVTLSVLSWLSSWLVSQTESYRDAVMRGSFGENGDKTKGSIDIESRQE